MGDSLFYVAFADGKLAFDSPGQIAYLDSALAGLTVERLGEANSRKLVSTMFSFFFCRWLAIIGILDRRFLFTSGRLL